MERHRFGSVLCLLTIFGSYCQMAPAAAGAGLFEAGRGYVFDYQATVQLNEARGIGMGKDVGFQISAGVSVSVVWQNPNDLNQKLFRLEVIKPGLHIKSRKAPSPEGFVFHTSKLDNAMNGPVLLFWEKGRVKSIYIDEQEERSVVNLKKGIASMFQFQLLDKEVDEIDSSGHCKTIYKTIDQYNILKVKKKCFPDKSLPYISHPDQVLGSNVISKRESLIELSTDLTKVQSISTEETHEMRVAIHSDVGSSVIARQHIKLTDQPVKTTSINGESLDEAIKGFQKSSKQKLVEQQLTLKRENIHCQDSNCPTFYKAVKENREHLQGHHLGSIRSAAAFVRLLPIAREAKMEEIYKVLKSPKNTDILPQLCDLVGATQSRNSHKAAMKFLHFDMEHDLDINERYLWALSLGSHPVKDVLSDIVKLTDKAKYGQKLAETSVLTLAAVVNRYRRMPGINDTQILEEIQIKLLENLSQCPQNDDDCKVLYLRALQNLNHEDTVSLLTSYALNGSKKVSVRAMKSLRSMNSSYWNADVLKAAEQIYFQIGKKYDSSARTLALDLLLECRPSEEMIKLLIGSLASADSAYEVKQYLLQRINQIAYRNKEFEESVKKTVRLLNMNNYHILAQKGLSTAFTRLFMNNPSANGSLSTVQEISSGIVKRGLVDIMLEQSGRQQSIFTLGLYAGGLSSFISSDEEVSPEDGEEVATAGMELTVLGVQIRPFVFFTGQGELMGHVWSSTGSERTPAFQILMLVQDHLQYIPLESGFIAELSLLGGISFDLAGQIQLSLWNRNAQSLVEKNAGISVVGSIRVDTMFVRSKAEFNLMTEVKLNLVSNIDFYNNIALCLQLRQPDSVIKHNIFKVERIPGSKHKLRKSKYSVLPVPGKTYALNQKNNEMCNIIFKDS